MTTPDTWHSHHLYLHCATEDTDAFLVHGAAPFLDGLVAAGEAAGWFFIRYGEGGPHVRLRVRGLSSAAAAALPGELARAAKAVPAVPGPWPSRHGEVRAVPYEPETGRYGGPRALPVAEEVFEASTRAALDTLRTLPADGGTGARLTAAADLAHTTVHALGTDPLTAARWLRGHAAGWRWVTEVPLLPGASVHTRVNTVYAAQRTGLGRRAGQLRGRLGAGTAEPRLLRWAAAVSGADERLRDLGEELRAWVWGSQLHMLFNRLGITPDEERAVCRLAARTLLETEEAPDYFPEGHTAADLRYLEKSKFQIGRGEDSELRDLPEGAERAWADRARAAGPELALTAAPLPDVPLSAVLAARTSTRGRLRGQLDAATLGSLLWHSLSESARSEQPDPDGGPPFTRSHRPYPSAGA
ncbi:thiopeptide-type bacteriocin biosynthesis protein, partial [Streptomyces sp. C]|uniref:thiopeptide-type bacteriocin biosynthesis protein n=1 Tax=Streptomyces sp. C TaxID=253839 RepID=UPI0001B561C8